VILRKTPQVRIFQAIVQEAIVPEMYQEILELGPEELEDEIQEKELEDEIPEIYQELEDEILDENLG